MVAERTFNEDNKQNKLHPINIYRPPALRNNYLATNATDTNKGAAANSYSNGTSSATLLNSNTTTIASAATSTSVSCNNSPIHSNESVAVATNTVTSPKANVDVSLAQPEMEQQQQRQNKQRLQQHQQPARRERRPDRAVYIPRARRSQTTPPTNTTVLQQQQQQQQTQTTQTQAPPPPPPPPQQTSAAAPTKTLSTDIVNNHASKNLNQQLPITLDDTTAAPVKAIASCKADDVSKLNYNTNGNSSIIGNGTSNTVTTKKKEKLTKENKEIREQQRRDRILKKTEKSQLKSNLKSNTELNNILANEPPKHVIVIAATTAATPTQPTSIPSFSCSSFSSSSTASLTSPLNNQNNNYNYNDLSNNSNINNNINYNCNSDNNDRKQSKISLKNCDSVKPTDFEKFEDSFDFESKTNLIINNWSRTAGITAAEESLINQLQYKTNSFSESFVPNHLILSNNFINFNNSIIAATDISTTAAGTTTATPPITTAATATTAANMPRLSNKMKSATSKSSASAAMDNNRAANTATSNSKLPNLRIEDVASSPSPPAPPPQPTKCDINEEHELQRASKEINRSNRRIMKQTFVSDVLEIPEHIDDIIDLKTIPSNDSTISTNNTFDSNTEEEEDEEGDWESMYDESGECIDPKIIEELTASVGKCKIELPKMDYSAYLTKQNILNDEEFPHVLEVSNFPVEFRNQDLLMVFSQYKESGFDIKWVDDTHALAVFSSSRIAAEVLTMGHPFVVLKPLAEATVESRLKAKKCAASLQPYRPRPETCAALARRLVTGALGVRLKTAAAERENEKRVLREAKERKLLAAKQRDEAWES